MVRDICRKSQRKYETFEIFFCNATGTGTVCGDPVRIRLEQDGTILAEATLVTGAGVQWNHQELFVETMDASSVQLRMEGGAEQVLLDKVQFQRYID